MNIGQNYFHNEDLTDIPGHYSHVVTLFLVCSRFHNEKATLQLSRPTNEEQANGVVNKPEPSPTEQGRGTARESKLFFSIGMWHHAGRPTKDHSTKTMGIHTWVIIHHGRRMISRKPQINMKSKHELLQKMNLTYLSQ